MCRDREALGMRLEWRSMSGDTSGACCQGKLSYPATSAPLPQQYTHTDEHKHTHCDVQPFFPTPEGEGKTRRERVMMKLLAEK